MNAKNERTGGKTMKRWIAALCALMLIPTLAGAESGKVSISELREQVEAMGRWTASYTDVKSRTVEVDVAPILPEVKTVPVMTARKPENAKENIENVCIPSMTTERSEDGATIVSFANAGTGDQMEIRFFEIGDQSISVEYQNTQTKMQENPDLFETRNGISICSNEVEWDKAYLDGYDLTPREVVKRANEKMAKLFPDLQLALEATWIEAVKNSVPLYSCELRQTVNGIPILLGAQSPVVAVRDAEFEKPKSWAKIGNSIWGDFRAPTWTFYCWVDGSYSFCMVPLAEDETIAADVPLSPLDRVIDSIEKQIEAGHIRDIYALRFGYCCYEGTEGRTILYPVWEVECAYCYSAKKEIPTDAELEDEPSILSGLFYRKMIVNAQTGEFIDPAKLMDRVFDCPEIMTWEDVQ